MRWFRLDDLGWSLYYELSVSIAEIWRFYTTNPEGEKFVVLCKEKFLIIIILSILESEHSTCYSRQSFIKFRISRNWSPRVPELLFFRKNIRIPSVGGDHGVCPTLNMYFRIWSSRSFGFLDVTCDDLQFHLNAVDSRIHPTGTKTNCGGGTARHSRDPSSFFPTIGWNRGEDWSLVWVSCPLSFHKYF